MFVKRVYKKHFALIRVLVYVHCMGVMFFPKDSQVLFRECGTKVVM